MRDRTDRTNRTYVLALGAVLAGAVFCAGVELKFAGIRLRYFELEYTTNLTNWIWAGTYYTPLTGFNLTVDVPGTNDLEVWRVRRWTNDAPN